MSQDVTDAERSGSAEDRESLAAAIDERAEDLQTLVRRRPTRKTLNFRDVRRPLRFVYTHEVEINGENGIARAHGTLDPDRGRIIYEGIVDRYIEGYKRWPVSWLTLVIVSGGLIAAAERLGGVNTLTLTDRELEYEVAVATRDEFAEIDTEIAVHRSGDTVMAHLRSRGEADYPEVIGMAPVPMRFIQTPTDDGFVETGTKQLVTADRELVESEIEVTYTGPRLEAEQVRDVTVEVLSESANRREVAIQVDSTVSPLRKAEVTDSVVFGGLEHDAVGEATLRASAGSLRVGRDGDREGEFGVSVTLGAAESLVTTPAMFDTPSLPDGASLRFEVAGTVDGEPDTDVGVLSITNTDGEAEYFCDLSPIGAETGTVTVFDGRRRVATVREVEGVAARVRDRIICDPIDPWIDDELVRWIVRFPEPREIVLSNGNTVVGDRLTVTPENEVQPVESLSTVRIVAADMPSFTLIDQAVGLFGHPHRALGEATFEIEDRRLTIGEIGTSGGDGVQVVLDDEQSFRAELDPLELDERDATLRLDATGIVDDRLDVPLGTADVMNVGEEYVVGADFSALDADEVRLEVFADGERVGRTVLDSGIVARLPKPVPITGCGKLPPRPLPCFIIDFLDEVSVLTADGAAFEGDQLRLLASGTDVEVGGLSEYGISAAGIESLSLLDEQVRNVG